jgi:hypothetical protein
MTNPAGPDYRDRKAGFVLFGVAEIVIGIFFALGIPLMLFARMAAHRSPDAPPPPIFSVLTVYAVAAIAFVWLGIGSILARRWARAVLLSLSGVALCGGVLGCVFLAFMLPRMFDALANSGPRALPPGALLVAKIATAGAMVVFYILIPGSIFLFYRSPHVKRTCEVHDPVERWTDRCPLPVLALCLLMAFGGIIALGLLGSFHGFPLFGMFVSGGAGTLLVILVAGLAFWLARGLYRLQVGAWWATLVVMLLSAASNTVTFWGPNLGDTYARMGIDRRAAALVGQMSGAFHWLLPLAMVPWVVWLLYVRRYFTTQAAPPAPTDAAPPVL